MTPKWNPRLNFTEKENGNLFLRSRFLQLSLIVLTLVMGMQAQDTQQCSNATLHGSYGFHATGTGFVAVGRFVFDGKGWSHWKTLHKKTGHEYWASRIFRNLFGSRGLYSDGHLGPTH